MLLVSFVGVLVPVKGQTSVEAKEGVNLLQLEIYNRTPSAFSEFQVRFAQDQPSWFTARGQATGGLKEYRGEAMLMRGRTRLQIPFEVAPGYGSEQLKLELVRNDSVIGTFDVLLSFNDHPGVSASKAEASDTAQVKGEGLEIAIPEAFALRQNYPNPFNPTTNIQFELPVASYVSLRVYDLLGQEIRMLVQGERSAGFHTVPWDGRNESGQTVPSGFYIYKIIASDFIHAQKMLLVR